MKPPGLRLELLPLLLAAHVSAEPPPYALAKAFHILPGTTSEESGYFSLSESLDGAIDVGTAKYNHNAFLVEFDPRSETQRIVLDTNQTCGLPATGYAAQSKLHTRNFVGPSGRVYVGSKQGYRKDGDTSEYGGGYVGRFDDALWADTHEIHENVEAQMKDYEKTPDNALVLRLGEWGLHRSIHDLFQRKHQRVMLITGENPRPKFAVLAGYDLRADYGAAFGDACVRLDGYPIAILPPSGVMQIAAYETINVEVQQRHSP